VDRKPELYRLLEQKGGFEVVRDTVSPEQLRVIGRIDQNRFNYWLSVMHQLLSWSAKPTSSWSCDISKQYMLAPDGVRHGWRIILQGRDLNGAAPEILKAIEQARKPAVQELSSQLLPGYQEGEERAGVRPNGKGASTIFSQVVGPKAVLRARNGGQ
jgi:hypothetical protein